jgi:hypothetical protein
MRRDEESGSSGSADQLSLADVLGRMTECLDRVMASMDAIATRVGAALPAEAAETAEGGGSAAATAGDVPASASPLGAGPFASSTSATGGPATTAIDSEPDRTPLANLVPSEGSSPQPSGADAETGLPTQAWADMDVPSMAMSSMPSAGLSQLQDISQDQASHDNQMQQIKIAQDQLTEQKKTNEHLEKQRGGQATVFGP